MASKGSVLNRALVIAGNLARRWGLWACESRHGVLSYGIERPHHGRLLRPTISQPKTAAGVRRVALDAQTVVALRTHMKRQVEERLSWARHTPIRASSSSNVGDRWVFRDGIHITAGESAALAPTFAKLLRHVAAA
jgi:hypothetical protein